MLLPGGDMLAVMLPEKEVQPSRQATLLAARAGHLCAWFQAPSAVDELEGKLSQQGVGCRRLHTSHAFHSQMMEPILGQFTEQKK